MAHVKKEPSIIRDEIGTYCTEMSCSECPRSGTSGCPNGNTSKPIYIRNGQSW